MLKLWTAPHGLHIEPATSSDVGDLARLHAAGFYRGWPREDFSQFLADRDVLSFVACDAKRRIAGFALVRLAGDEAELITIAVDPKWRGKGVGGALLRAGLEALLMTAARTIFLEVAEDNPAAIALYRRHGFEAVGRRAAYYARADGRPAAALVMRRVLG